MATANYWTCLCGAANAIGLKTCGHCLKRATAAQRCEAFSCARLANGRRIDMNDPIISIDRQTRSYALFDGPYILREFQAYQDEAGAIAEGTRWFSEHHQVKPRVVYPMIRSIRTSMRVRK